LGVCLKCNVCVVGFYVEMLDTSAEQLPFLVCSLTDGSC